jgi:CspA family cold shock protein
LVGSTEAVIEAAPVIFTTPTYQEIKMQTGTVKWFDGSKGFGFVIPESGGADIYFHLKVLQKAGLEAIETGTSVRFSAASRGEKEFLTEIAVIAAPKPAPVRTRASKTVVNRALEEEDEFEREWGLRRG